MKIYGVQSGPWEADDGTYWNVCKVVENGKVFDEEIYFGTLDDAYEMIKYFSKNIDPIELDFEEEEEDYE